ncbi:dihydroneopterin aldolase [Hephaestia sp. GCM10023244]|uniref:dihydroneopterin aldolase n=1 Tax=unclassified Hephaestia TaxID=2631281 RepID=UPI002076E3E8|nr:dihydroneopterin aldolase [Hephaestia sp. MAHUQ-44]MCM8730157.1 dihydroneopterin aldolase [Hephaestia sp. MAHUQ-44]
MSAVFTTILDGLEVTMRLGIHADEVTTPQRVRLSVWMEVDYGANPPGDRIDEAVDYDFVRRGIHDFSGHHFALQETLCEAIAALCLRDPRVRSVRVRSMKPDIYPDAAIGCEIVRTAIG